MVLLWVLATVQLPGAVGRLARFGVVTCGDVAAAHIERCIEQRAKLNMAVADDARVGRQPLLIGSHEALDNVAVEGLLQVEHMVGYPQALGDGLCIGDVAVDLTHARNGIGRGAGEAHGGADAFVALAFEQVRGHAGIDAAAHGDEHALVVHGEVLLGGMWPKKKSGAGRLVPRRRHCSKFGRLVGYPNEMGSGSQKRGEAGVPWAYRQATGP